MSLDAMKSNYERMLSWLTACFYAYNDIDNMLFGPMNVVIMSSYAHNNAACCQHRDRKIKTNLLLITS